LTNHLFDLSWDTLLPSPLKEQISKSYTFELARYTEARRLFFSLPLPSVFLDFWEREPLALAYRRYRPITNKPGVAVVSTAALAKSFDNIWS
jgi:hypothetical protein